MTGVHFLGCKSCGTYDRHNQVAQVALAYFRYELKFSGSTSSVDSNFVAQIVDPLCEAARRRQARVTASARLGRYFDDRTRRRVGPKPAAGGIPLACASAQSPSRRREGP
jgi:hypothetical protein